jgi:hypothetical protein
MFKVPNEFQIGEGEGGSSRRRRFLRKDRQHVLTGEGSDAKEMRDL